jgi:DNA-directed RNA polymerase subunit RPC12/RpoP
MREKKPHKPQKAYDACPHCGNRLSPWQQVLLSVDREIMCKNCWYRIILPVFDQEKQSDQSNQEKPQGE